MPVLDRWDTGPSRTEFTKRAQLNVPIPLPPAVVDSDRASEQGERGRARHTTPNSISPTTDVSGIRRPYLVRGIVVYLAS